MLLRLCLSLCCLSLCSCGFVHTKQPIIPRGVRFELGLEGKWIYEGTDPQIAEGDWAMVTRDPEDRSQYLVKVHTSGQDLRYRFRAARLNDEEKNLALVQVIHPERGPDALCYYGIVEIKDDRLLLYNLDGAKLVLRARNEKMKHAVQQNATGYEITANENDLLRLLGRHHREFEKKPVISRRAPATE